MIAAGTPHFVTPAERIESLMLLALASSGQGDTAAAQEALSRISNASLRAQSDDLQTEVQYTRALCAWRAGQAQRAQDLLRHMDTEDPVAETKALILHSWIAASNDRFTAQGDLLVKGLTTMQQASVPDLGVMYKALHALAGVCREVFIPQATDFAVALARNFPWPHDSHLEEFQTFRALGWAVAMQGDYIHGIRSVNRSKELAPSKFWLVLSRLDHAMMAFATGEASTAQAELLDADDLIRSLDWSQTQNEEVVALLLAAELFARVDPHRAREHLDHYFAVRDRIPESSGFRHTKRLLGMEHYARAAIEQSLGNSHRALSHASAAFEIFRRLRFNWRAARAALIMHACGGGDRWLAEAAEKIRDYPRSFIAVEVERKQLRARTPSLNVLTPTERNVFEVLCAGGSIEDTAARLGTKPNTIRNHIRSIHRKFGVKNRSQLLVAASRLGLLQ